jgi:hypothetical protein
MELESKEVLKTKMSSGDVIQVLEFLLASMKS